MELITMYLQNLEWKATGKELRHKRKLSNITIADIAANCNLDRKKISALERGKRLLDRTPILNAYQTAMDNLTKQKSTSPKSATKRHTTKRTSHLLAEAELLEIGSYFDLITEDYCRRTGARII